MASYSQIYGASAEQLAVTNGMLADATEQSVTVVAEVGRQVAQFSADFVDMRDHLIREHGVLEAAARSLGEAALTLIRMADRVGTTGVRRDEPSRESPVPQLAAVQAQLQAVNNTLAAGVQSLAASLSAADSRVSGSSASFERAATALAAWKTHTEPQCNIGRYALATHGVGRGVGQSGRSVSEHLAHAPFAQSNQPGSGGRRLAARHVTTIETRQSACDRRPGGAAASLRPELAQGMHGRRATSRPDGTHSAARNDNPTHVPCLLSNSRRRLAKRAPAPTRCVSGQVSAIPSPWEAGCLPT